MRKPSGVSIPKLKADPEGYSDIISNDEETIVSLARYLDYLYHAKNKSAVPDEVYDILKDTITERWPRSKYLKEIGHKVAASKRTETVPLPAFMPSMDKCKLGTKALANFLSRKGMYIIGDKLDGISLLLQYEDGVLSKCFTRGDGSEGQDVSGVIPALRAPKRISTKAFMLVRCEFIIKKKSFGKKHSKSAGGKYSTGRNMGGGLLTHNQPTSQVRSFDCVAYEISKGPGAGKKLSAQLSILKRLKFTVVRTKKVKDLTDQRIEQLHDEFKTTASYEIDGVIMTKDVGYSASRSNPTHAKAFKINSLVNSQVVSVKAVEYRRSRQNKLIPRIIVAPITLGGVTVEYFAGHSYYYIQRGFTFSEYKKAKKEGRKLRTLPINKEAKIRVIRSGDVIPYVMGVEKPARKAAQPNVPFTLGPNNVHAIATDVAGSTEKKKIITHFFSSLKIEGLKAGTISKLYDAGFDDVGKILFAEYDELMEVEGIQARTAKNIIKNIDIGLSKAKFSTIGYASHQFDDAIGTRRLQAVIDMYPDYVEQAERKSVRQLTAMLEAVPGIKTQAKSISEGTKRFLVWLDDIGLNLEPEEAVKPQSNKLNGLSVLFTGIRDPELSDAIVANGGKIASSVKGADLLIIKPNYSNKKTDYAEENDIPMLTVDLFRQEYNI